MSIYTCPTCGEKMERDLLLFIEHTDQHVVEEIKKRHPSWITKDGFCPQCLDYFKKAIRNPGTLAAAEALEAVNIGPREIRKRLMLGASGLGAGFLMMYGLQATGAPRLWRLYLFLPFFASALGFFQARKKLCVVFAQKGIRNMDAGEEVISNPSQARVIRRRSIRIWILSVFVAALLTAICVLL